MIKETNAYRGEYLVIYCPFCDKPHYLDKETGYVRLSKDQSLPENPYPIDYIELPAEFQEDAPTCEDVYLMTSNGVEKGFSLMLEAGFRRIEL